MSPLWAEGASSVRADLIRKGRSSMEAQVGLMQKEPMKSCFKWVGSCQKEEAPKRPHLSCPSPWTLSKVVSTKRLEPRT